VPKVGLEAIGFIPNEPVAPKLISPQHLFLITDADEALYGGAAGGGKSIALIADAAAQAHLESYSAILFRKTIGDLQGSDGLLEKTNEFYVRARANYSAGQMRWRFLSVKGKQAGTVTLRHLRNKEHVTAHEGLAYAFIGFDELQQHNEEDYIFLTSRNRCVNPEVKLKIRATANPGGNGHGWIKKRWGAWLDKKYPKGYAIDHEAFKAKGLKHSGKRADSGEVRWFLRVNDVETEVPEGTKFSRSRTFIAALLQDNPYLMRNQNYMNTLMNLPLVKRNRLLFGDWEILEDGNIFKREWFHIVRTAPRGLQWFRGIDCASSEEKQADNTAYAEIAFDGRNNLYIRFVGAEKLEWSKQREWLKEVVFNDPLETGIERASNGSALYSDFRNDPDLVHLRFFSVVPDRDKVERASIWSYRAEQGKVYLVEGSWNDAFVDECVAFPMGLHDDRVDAVSLAVTLALKRMRVDDGLGGTTTEDSPENSKQEALARAKFLKLLQQNRGR
jgi:predicted phage terminase large subunit-like protein